MHDRPFSQACENNREPILEVLRSEFRDVDAVLEIGSGTGQHGAYFAPLLPWLEWQPSDVEENLPGIDRWRTFAGAHNLLPPVPLDVRDGDWGVAVPAGVFTANSLHIMAWSAAEQMFRYLADHAPAPCRLCIYGPFNYGGRYTSDSNARFDEWLAARDPDSAIRDFEGVDELAKSAGFVLQHDHAMPANNRLLSWRR